MDTDNRSPQDNEFYQKGLAAYRKKNYGYAIELFKEALKAYPDYHEYEHYLWLSLREKRSASAAVPLRSLVEMLAIAFLSIKLSLLQIAKKTNRVKALLKKIIAINPNNASALYKLAMVFAEEGKTQQAIHALEEILAFNRENIKTLKTLSRLYYNNKEYEKAKLTATKLLKLSPQDIETENILKNIAALGTIEGGFDEKPAA